MLTFILPLIYSLFILFSTITAQPYKAIDHFLIDCGTSSISTTSNLKWDGDEVSNFVPSNITTTSFSSTPYSRDSSVPEIPYSTARIFNSSAFTYTFPVSQGPKFLRLFFYPAPYSGLNPNQSFFSVSSNGFSLLTNFSAFLTASYLGKNRDDAGGTGPPVPHFVKEFMIYVKDTQILTVTFTPSPNSYAFINGIEIVSTPENLYFNAKKPKPVAMTTGPLIDERKALENMYRLNMGGGQIPVNNDTSMYRSWDPDNQYIFPLAAIGLMPFNITPITYTNDTPSYTAPELVYGTQRNIGNKSRLQNLSWKLPVDSGFYYMLRLHFCSIIRDYTRKRHPFVKILINNQTAEDEADLFVWTPGAGYPVFKDYVVYVNDPDGRKSKQYLWLDLYPNSRFGYYLDAYLNGLEAFKLSMNRNLSSPNPEFSAKDQSQNWVSSIKGNKKRIPPYPMIIGGVGGGLVLLSVLLVIVLQGKRRIQQYASTHDKPSWGQTSSNASLPSESCRSFTLKEVKIATNEFNENCVIGNGGFGKVYKGYIDKATTTAAIKRLNISSSQGFREFRTEIGLLSKLRHVNLVSLIGYCDENGEMVLVYDYMAQGTLRDHLYKADNRPLSWKRRLDICIGIAKGLHYLHTGGKRAIIHRDIKSTNILLDENWVAKVSDFGLSKLGSEDPLKTHVSTMVKGSFGYIDPEYFRSQQLTEKSDVYSFGVVLFEVLCGRPVINQWETDEKASLVEWGKTCYQKGTLDEMIDEKLRGEITSECLRKFGEVASSCLHEQGSERPIMEEVVWGLEFSLQLQAAAEKMNHATMSENQELPFLMEREPNN